LAWAARSGFTRKGGLLAGIAALLLLAGASTPAFGRGVGIPLVWPSMPWTAWGFAACILGCVVRIAGARLTPAAIWGALAAGFALLYQLGPDHRMEALRGWIALSVPDIAAILALLFASTVAMVMLGRRVQVLAKQIALLAGCVIFGAPFLWLLVTSFKEDRDMTSPNGIVWIPRVQETVPYLDRDDPLFQGSYEGATVEGTSIGRSSDGAYVVSIQRPSSVSGITFTAQRSQLKEIPKDAPVVQGPGFTGFVVKELDDGRRTVKLLSPTSLKGTTRTMLSSDLQPVRHIGLRWKNYTEAMEALPPETHFGFVYLKNTLILVVLSVVGTLLSSSLVAYGFARIQFPGRDLLFKILLATMMLPAAVTLVPQFLLFRSLGWIDTLLPLWVPAFFASAFNVFLLRQFFAQIPKEFEDAGKIDGAGVLRIFWTILLPQVKPALAVVAIWTSIGAWNNFMGPLIYIDSPENMPLAYAVQLFQGERGGEPGLMMAFATLTTLPVIAVFFFAQRYFIEGVALSGLGGR
jgi:multiple sugar transport system permease protein